MISPRSDMPSETGAKPSEVGTSLPNGGLTGPWSGATTAGLLLHASAPSGYEILGELGRGGMGVVYQARQQGLNRIVALKMILAGEHAGPDEIERFRTEAEAIARLQHPHIVQIFEIGDHQGKPFFSLELCSGGSLEDKVRAEPLTPRAAAELVETLARAMQAAHDAYLIHRDLKPANVLLAADGTPKIADFGLAKKLDLAEGKTRTGAVMGTPSYMAPEQAEGKKAIGPAADIYGLGAILYKLLTGEPPFRACTALDTILKVIGDEPVPPRLLAPNVPLDLETICLRCLRKKPAQRYANAVGLADDLCCWLKGEPIQSRPEGDFPKAVRWAKRNPIAVAMLLAALAMGYWMMVNMFATSSILLSVDGEGLLWRVGGGLIWTVGSFAIFAFVSALFIRPRKWTVLGFVLVLAILATTWAKLYFTTPKPVRLPSPLGEKLGQKLAEMMHTLKLDRLTIFPIQLANFAVYLGFFSRWCSRRWRGDLGVTWVSGFFLVMLLLLRFGFGSQEGGDMSNYLGQFRQFQPMVLGAIVCGTVIGAVLSRQPRK